MKTTTNVHVAALASTCAVTMAGTAPADVLFVPVHQPTIQAAIDAAADGDVVIVLPGTYNERIDYHGKAITVRSVNPSNPNVVANTILDGSGLDGSIVRFVSGETSESALRGMTIRNGTGDDLYVGGDPGQAACDPDGDGSSCADALPISGSVSAPANATTWYCYTPNCDGPALMSISQCGPDVTRTVYESCGGALVPVEDTFDCVFSGFATTYRVIGGTSYIIEITVPDHPPGAESVGIQCFQQKIGGAIHVDASSPTIARCVVASNSANRGGGMYINLGEPTLDHCTFEGNSARNGGGLYINDGSVVARDCHFVENAAVDGSGFEHGGGINNSGGQVSLVGCSFTRNSMGWQGGAISNTGTLQIRNCTFEENFAAYVGSADGSAIRNSPSGTLVIVDSNFVGNVGAEVIYDVGASAMISGCLFDSNDFPRILSDSVMIDTCTFVNSSTGATVIGEDETIITNCAFVGNAVVGLALAGDNAIVVNCVFRDNGAGANPSGPGGGLTVTGDPHIVNCTFANNHCGGIGGGILYVAGAPTIRNVIIHGNSPNQLVTLGGVVADVEYSNIEGGWAGLGNIDVDPMFGDVDLRLASGSPCIDAADNAAVPGGVTTDLDGNPRFADDADTIDTGNGAAPIVDMGAYEFGGGCPADVFPPNGGNGVVNVADLLFVVMNFGTPDGDVDGDGDTDVFDLLAVLASWGAC